MTTEPSRQTTGDSALSSLYDARNVARRAMSVGPALESTNELLNAIRESAANKPDYAELEQSCVGVHEVLSRGTSRRQDDYLSRSALEAIEELTATANEIKKNIVKQGKRRAISEVFRPKKEKEAIASWRLSLNRILCVLDIEFGSDEPVTVPATRHDGADPHIAVVDAHSGTSSTETTAPTAPHNVSSSSAVSEVPAEVVNMHALSHETHRDAARSGEGKGSPGCSTRVSVARNAHGTTSDICSRIENMHTTMDTHEMFKGMPQGAIKGVGDNYQAEESVPGESLPLPLEIFGREELVKEIVDLMDADDPTPIALTGTGGIGKTSVALAVLHDDRIKRLFGDHRRLLRCDQFSPSLPNFLRRLSEVIGAGIENPTDLAPLRPFLHRTKMLLLIDNGESLFGGSDIEDILSVMGELSQSRNICLCITSRVSIVPARCKVIDVPTLSTEAARETFHSIYRRGEQSDAVDDILKQLDFHPLSITLLATATKQNKWGISELEKEWKEQRTGVLRTRYQGSLAATIEFSLRSPMFLDLGRHARDLLGVVAFFPQGVDENNLDWFFPAIKDRKNIFGHFCTLSLAHRHKGFITMLAPLRDHLCPKDPTSALFLCAVKEHYFSRLSFSAGTVKRSDQTTWIASEDMNVEYLLDIFTSTDVNSESVWDACGHFMFHLSLHKPRLPVFGPKIRALPDGYPSKPRCLSELSGLYTLVGNSAECRRLLHHALKIYREREDGYRIASTLRELAATNSSHGLCEEGIQQVREAISIYRRLGNVMAIVRCYTWLSPLFRGANRVDDAEECENQAIELIDALMPTADSGSRVSLHTALSKIYSCRGDTEKAIFHLEASLGVMPGRTSRFYIHCELAKIHIEEGRLDDAEAHLEHAGSLATNSSSELLTLTFLRVDLLRGQGKFVEARSEASCVLGLVEELGAGGGGGDRVEEAKRILHSIDEEIADWASLGELLAPRPGQVGPRTIRAAPGGDTSQTEEKLEAARNLMALLEKDGNRPGGPNFLQISKALKEFVTLVDQSDDKEVDEAIAEGLAIPMAVDEPNEITPPEPLMRQDDGPVVIWAMDPKLAHIGQLWQALYYVPQVRHRISQYRSSHLPEGDTEVDSSPGGTGGHILSAHELFGHMELSGLGVVTGKSRMEQWPHRPWEDISPCEEVEGAYMEFSEQVEISLNDGLATRYPDWPRLFHSRINDATSQERLPFDAEKDFSLISLDYNDGDGSSDLMGCLKNQVFPEFREQGSDHTTNGGCATMEPADVIAFAAARDENTISTAAGGAQQRRKFSFPESFCLDQFITTSRARAQDINIEEGEILRKTGSGPARPNNEDVMKGILPSLHHSKDVADPPMDVERHSPVDGSAGNREDGVAHVEAERKSIGTGVEQSERAQGNKYDLRAVLMHDGQKGRRHVYSYINHDEAWWKVTDPTVTQVTFETVLNDEDGMDVGAGPFFLVYSRSLSGPLKSEWPEALKVTYNGNSGPSGSKLRRTTDET